MSTWVTGTTVVENSVNAETMTSNVTITLIVGWNSGSWAGDSPYYYINVNGSRKKSGNANFNTGQATSGSQTIATWTGDVPHNADGTGSMTWDVGYEGIYAGEGRYSTASGTKTLTTIVVDDSNRFLDKSGLAYFWSKLKSFFVAKETGKGLSTNDFTTAEKTKLSGIETGAEVNVIESIALNGTDQTITNKAVDLELVTSVNGQTGDVIVEGGEGGGTSNNMVTLWTNPNPTSAFAQQTISLDLSDYDAILIECNTAGSGTGTTTQLGFVGTTVRLMAEIYQIHRRLATINSDGITFGNNYYLPAYANGNETVSNGYLIPTKIIGLKIKGVGKSGQLELAWSNPSPTASFAPQTITLKDNYPVVFVVSTYSASDDITSKNGTVSTIISGYRGQVIAWNENMTWTYGRSCVLNGSSLVVGDARWLVQSSTASSIQNDTCIPKFVFGLKTVSPKVGKTLLWTNPNPTSNFSAQTVTLANDANQYDMLMVESRYGATEDSISSSFLEPTVTTRQTVMSARYVVNATTTIVMRDATINGTQITITTGRYIVPNGMGEGTQYAIPLKIYGINFSGASSPNYYTAGDTYSIPTALQADTSMSLIIGSHVTDGGKRCDFTVYLPKSMEHVTPSVTSLRMNGRTTGGAYMNFSGSQSHVTNGFETVGASGYTISLTKITDYALTISVTRSGGYGATNNTPVSLEINQLSLSFA